MNNKDKITYAALKDVIVTARKNPVTYTQYAVLNGYSNGTEYVDDKYLIKDDENKRQITFAEHTVYWPFHTTIVFNLQISADNQPSQSYSTKVHCKFFSFNSRLTKKWIRAERVLFRQAKKIKQH